MDIFEDRRSIRRFQEKDVDQKALLLLLKAASFAPSGLNNQPWRFRIVRDRDLHLAIAGFTHYSSIIKNAPVLICVFLDKESVYHREKDIMSIGAAIQNMLLKAHILGLGACWLGEIINRKDEVSRLLGVKTRYELMAVVALGYPAEVPEAPKRLDITELLI